METIFLPKVCPQFWIADFSQNLCSRGPGLDSPIRGTKLEVGSDSQTELPPPPKQADLRIWQLTDRVFCHGIQVSPCKLPSFVLLAADIFVISFLHHVLPDCLMFMFSKPVLSLFLHIIPRFVSSYQANSSWCFIKLNRLQIPSYAVIDGSLNMLQMPWFTLIHRTSVLV